MKKGIDTKYSGKRKSTYKVHKNKQYESYKSSKIKMLYYI